MTVRADKLLRMAEQIAQNVVASDDPAIVAERTADHLTRFWDPRMRRALLDYMADNDSDASPAVKLAVQRLR